MAKYDALSAYLQTLSSPQWTASFSEIEKILKFRLPASAQSYAAWWSNQADGGHSQSAAWQNAGFRTGSLDLKGKKITFTRERAVGKAPVKEPAAAAKPMVRAEAAAPSGGEGGLTLAQAKAGLAKQFGVPAGSIEIVIRG